LVAGVGLLVGSLPCARTGAWEAAAGVLRVGARELHLDCVTLVRLRGDVGHRLARPDPAYVLEAELTSGEAVELWRSRDPAPLLSLARALPASLSVRVAWSGPEQSLAAYLTGPRVSGPSEEQEAGADPMSMPATATLLGDAEPHRARVQRTLGGIVVFLAGAWVVALAGTEGPLPAVSVLLPAVMVVAIGLIFGVVASDTTEVLTGDELCVTRRVLGFPVRRLRVRRSSELCVRSAYAGAGVGHILAIGQAVRSMQLTLPTRQLLVNVFSRASR
jgi:hypothetical protein